jgi:hypothetical protein
MLSKRFFLKTYLDKSDSIIERLMLFRSRTFSRFLLVLFIFSLVPTLIVAWITLKRGRKVIYEQSLIELSIVADGTEAQVREYLNYNN